MYGEAVRRKALEVTGDENNVDDIMEEIDLL